MLTKFFFVPPGDDPPSKRIEREVRKEFPATQFVVKNFRTALVKDMEFDFGDGKIVVKMSGLSARKGLEPYWVTLEHPPKPEIPRKPS